MNNMRADHVILIIVAIFIIWIIMDRFFFIKKHNKEMSKMVSLLKDNGYYEIAKKVENNNMTFLW